MLTHLTEWLTHDMHLKGELSSHFRHFAVSLFNHPEFNLVFILISNLLLFYSQEAFSPQFQGQTSEHLLLVWFLTYADWLSNQDY